MEVTVHEAKTHLSRLLRQVEAGEDVLIKRGTKRVALLTAAPEPTPERRNIWGTGRGSIPDDFDAHVPGDFADHV